MINRIKARGTLSPEQFVDAALDLMGPLEVGAETRQELADHAREGGALQWGTPDVDKGRAACGPDAAIDRGNARVSI